MSNIKVNYYWCDIDNFGDELNVELMRVLCNWRLKHTPPAMATVLGIGSILDRAVATQNDDVPFFCLRGLRSTSSPRVCHRSGGGPIAAAQLSNPAVFAVF